MDDSTRNFWTVILAALQLLTVLVAAGWAYFRFSRERTHSPHIEFLIDARFFTPRDEHRLTEFTLITRNKGLVVHRFHSIKLRVRGISDKTPLSFWKGNEPRACFPEKLVDDAEVIFKPKYDHIFVEPGVEQSISFTTLIPASIAFIAARAEFQYDEEQYWPHSTERVFSVSQSVA
jgi:hypothetical protein